MLSVPDELRQHLRQYDQEHVLAWWDRLSDAERRELLDQLQGLDLDLLRCLFAKREQSFALPAPERIVPAPIIPRNSPANADSARLGEEALSKGEVAVLVVAGGQGSRLGFEHPKGMFPVGPISHKSLFQVHAEKVLARSRRHGKPLPFLVMTSHATHEETVAFFKEHAHFGLPADEVFFFTQGTMPALDLATGRLLLEAPGRLFLSPDGHGGTLTALARSGLLEQLRRRGIRHVFYIQVDNPLLSIADPVFLGHHIAGRAEASSKIIPKQGPKDKLGNLVAVDGRCTIIEYSDLPEELAVRTDETGRLWLWAGSPAIHVFDLDFLGRVTQGQGQMPFHIARKKVPHLGPDGQVVQPDKENALKFERFIFDVLPLAERWTVVETSHRAEFAPLKNASGPDSPEAVEKAIAVQAGDWLTEAGVSVPLWPDGSPAVALEINPLFALDAQELARRVAPSLKIEGPTYLGADL